jgi:nucleotide-binding universal stress UspA family protein
MYRKILLPIDSAGVPDDTARHIISLARVHNAAILGLRVIPIVSSGEAFFDKVQVELGSRGARLRDAAQAQFARLGAMCKEAGVAFAGEVIFTERGEAEAIATYAAENGCDLIAMPVHPRTALSRWLMGNVEDKVRRRATVPVLFIPVAVGSGA